MIAHDPSFLPNGSSYSIPTQMPLANLVGPRKRMVPRFLSLVSPVSTSHREPNGMSMSELSGTSTSDGGAKRPTL